MFKQLISAILMTTIATAQHDPFQWLEEIDGEKQLAWVEEQNAITLNALTNHPKFTSVYEKTLEIMNSDARIPYPGLRGEFVYNFWQDQTYPRGVWRRTTLEEYRKENPAWENMLDIAKLADKEDESWSYKGVDVLTPDYDVALVKLSRGGGDAVVVREFDMKRKAFIEDGFKLDEAKTRVSWLDRDTLLVGTDFGEGSMTSSGYPRQVKKWKRGTPLTEAELIFEGKNEDVAVGAFVQVTADRKYTVVYRNISFYESEYYAYENGKLIKLDLPLDADPSGFFKGHLLVRPKKEWKTKGQTLASGSLVALDYVILLKGEHKAHVLFQPSEKDSLGDVSFTKNQVLIRIFKGGRFDELDFQTLENGEWKKQEADVPEYGTLSVISADDFSDRFFLSYESALSPSKLIFYTQADAEPVDMKSMPAFFDASKFEVKLHEAISKDGTPIPYSVVFPKTGKMDGSTPTLLYGYGGFEISLRPSYSPVMGATWLENGGAFAVANIRGGGEFGPAWHEAARKENKQKSYDDFIAISEDLIKRGYASPKTLGIQGGSNGGLLVGAVTMQRPELYSAVVCEVPLLDMKRYHKLLAGASWMAEYGDPDNPEEWKFISPYSPYQNISKDRNYPKMLIKTTTRDDRVHPGHARKMAAKLEAMGHPVFYFENTEGGHGSGVTNEQRAKANSLSYVYLLKMLKK